MIPPFPIPQALALSTEAGWNQNAADWQRLFRLAPDGCFGAWAGERLVSTTVALVYEKRLAWIGMVLTTESQRGKGHARNLLLQALDYCDRGNIESVKLDATDLGRPVYAKLGFVDERAVSRWIRPASSRPASPVTGPGPIDLQLDLEAFGADRSAFLQLLAAENETYSIPGRGFAFARPGRLAWHFGPSVSRDADSAATLLQAFLAAHGDQPSMLDLCDEHEAAARIARQAGYQPVRRLLRMYRGDPRLSTLASGNLIYALGAFEYG
ncbi:MAG: GNAT family N-acetyltransferase [Bryobacterales bacterium]|nr:GNAT family N-acetyltransferase [Bryobacterales bacterium]